MASAAYLELLRREEEARKEIAQYSDPLTAKIHLQNKEREKYAKEMKAKGYRYSGNLDMWVKESTSSD